MASLDSVNIIHFMRRIIESVAVFSGASSGIGDEYRKAAESLGNAIGKRGLKIVYGGGYCGLMGVIAENAGKHGSHIIGVLPSAMNTPDVRMKSVETELIIVPDMHERKSRMYSLSDAFIAAPGGIGTMEELLEIYTWLQLGYHQKNVALYNTCGYWNPLIAMIDKGTKEGFISESVRDALIIESDPDTLLDRLTEERNPLPAKHG